MTKNFFYKSRFLLAILLLASLSVAYSQSTEKVMYGTLDTNVISVEEFKMQRNLKLSSNIILDSALIYFSIPGQSSIALVNYYPFFDSLNFKKYSDLLAPGARVIFKIEAKQKLTNKLRYFQLSFIFYGMAKIKIDNNSIKYLEWKRLRDLEYLNGNIYFSGKGFSNVIIFGQEKKDYNQIEMCFDRCTIGSIITFDNVTFREKNGIVSLLNKQFKL